MSGDLKLFQGFSRDMAADLTGLRPGEIDWLREQKIVTPIKRGGSYIYTFTDLLVLRLVRLLKLNHVPVKNIKKAKDYLSKNTPGRSLINTTLYIGDRTGKVYYIGEKHQKDVLVELTKGGQLVMGDFVTVLRVGRDLDQVRKNVYGLDKKLASRVKKPSFVSADEVYRQYGLA